MTLRKLLGRWAQALYSEDQKRQRLQQKKRRQKILQQRKKAKEAARTLGFADFFLVVSVCVVSPKWKSFSGLPSVVSIFCGTGPVLYGTSKEKSFWRGWEIQASPWRTFSGRKSSAAAVAWGMLRISWGHSDDVMPSVTCDEAWNLTETVLFQPFSLISHQLDATRQWAWSWGHQIVSRQKTSTNFGDLTLSLSTGIVFGWHRHRTPKTLGIYNFVWFVLITSVMYGYDLGGRTPPRRWSHTY